MSQRQGRSNMKRTEAQDEADVALGRRLRSLRVKHGVTQTALGAVLGVSYQQIQKYESGERRCLAALAEEMAARRANRITPENSKVS
jgi:DNA-binding XRE family transcriptional regulator